MEPAELVDVRTRKLAAAPLMPIQNRVIRFKT